MGGEFGEVKLSGNKKYDHANGTKASIPTCPTFCSLKQAVYGLQKAVGVTCACPSDDTVEVGTNHLGDMSILTNST